MTFCFEPIGIVHSCFKEKFGIPRQAGLIPEAEATLEILPPFDRAEAFREIEGYSHLWLTFVFHAAQGGASVAGGRTPGATAAQGSASAVGGVVQGRDRSYDPSAFPPSMGVRCTNAAGGRMPETTRTPETTTTRQTQWSPTVRPPRLGGNRRVGVFASRSPFRPNPIGLSLVRLLSVDFASPHREVQVPREAGCRERPPHREVQVPREVPRRDAQMSREVPCRDAQMSREAGRRERPGRGERPGCRKRPPMITLRLGGIDLLDGTPVLDIKPYLPYADVAPNARAGFAPEPPGRDVEVEFSTAAQTFLDKMHRQQTAHMRLLIQQILQNDPRPAYLHDNASRREFGMRLYDLNIRWRVEQEQVVITTIEPYQKQAQ